MEHFHKKRTAKKLVTKKRVLGKQPTNELPAIVDFLDNDLAGVTDDEAEANLEDEERFEVLRIGWYAGDQPVHPVGDLRNEWVL